MSVIENIDVVMGARTAELDAGVTKAVKDMDRLKAAATGFGGQGFGADFTKGLASQATSITSLATGFGLATAAAGGFYAVISSVRGQLSEIDDLSDVARKLSMDFNELQTVRMAAKFGPGMDAGATDASMQRMMMGLGEANATQSGAVFDQLTMLGLDAGELLKAGPLDALKQISAATQDLQNPTDQLMVAYDLFGKQGSAMVDVLRQGPDAIDAMSAKMDELGMSLTNAQAEGVGAANDAWDQMTMVATGAMRQVAAEIAPVIQVIAENITAAGAGFGGWIPLIQTTVDTTVFFAGTLYDAYEVATLTHKTLYNIATLNFDQIGEDIASAADFGTGQRNLDAVTKARMDAQNAAAANKKDPAEESAIAQAEAARNAAKEAAKLQEDARKQAEADEKRAAKEREDAQKRLEDRARSIINESLTADQAILARVQEMVKLREAGMLNEKQFNMAMREVAKKSAEASMKDTPEYRGAVSAQAGSVEAYKMLLDRDKGAINEAMKQTALQDQMAKGIEMLNTTLKNIQPMKAAR